MLAVQAEHRGQGIGASEPGTMLIRLLATKLVESAIQTMIEKGADEVCLLDTSHQCLLDMPGDRDLQPCGNDALRKHGVREI
jgi:GNAT superfamily N-acetyltransferase